MQRIIKFWQKDVINKLIVLVMIFIIAIAFAFVYLITIAPEGKSLKSIFFPTPTLSVQDIFRISAQTATAKAVNAAASVVPTITTMPLKPKVMTPTPAVTQPPSGPTETPAPVSELPSPTATTAPTQGPTASADISANGACIPKEPAETGTVLEILDGNTIRVLIKDLVYTVRYIGVALPADINQAQMSKYKNGELVFAQQVKLIADSTDKDASGSLLRYAIANDTFVNLALLQQGLGVVAEQPVQFNCLEAFRQGEASAKAGQFGLWKNYQPANTP